MLFHDRWLSRSQRTRQRSVPLPLRLGLERLEDRSLPSTFTVTNLGDLGMGSGLEGDLRYAVSQADSNRDLSNQIVFQPGLSGTIVLTRGSLDITKDLILAGPGQQLLTVSGNQRSGVFNITADPRVHDVRLADLTVAGGAGIAAGTVVTGGGLYNDHAAVSLTRMTFSGNSVPDRGRGGAIYNGSGTLTLDAGTVVDNRAGSSAYGAGIYNETGTLTVTNSTLMGNVADPRGGGIFNNQGMVTVRGSTLVHNTGTAISAAFLGFGDIVVDHCTISANTGGGLYTSFSLLQLTDSTVSDNSGPGITSVAFRIQRSTISGNFNPNGVGGGIYNDGGPSVCEIDNSTITGNVAALGGGILVGPVNSIVTMDHCTIVDNHAVGTGANDGGGGIYITGNVADGFGTLFIGHSIVANNDSAAPFSGQDVDGPVTSLQANFIGNGDFSDGWNTTVRFHDRVGTTAAPLDPMLGPLQDNGGPTLTRAPLAGSPILDLNDYDQSPDQRGSFRGFFGGGPGAVAASPARAFRVSAPLVVAPGQPFQISVTAVDQWGNTASTYHGTAHFSSTDFGAQLPDDYTFGAADGGTHTFDVALQTSGLQSIQIQDTTTASLAAIMNLVVEDGAGPGTSDWGSHRLGG
jgi:hypothetical protein